jgi:hypothetical protein
MGKAAEGKEEGSQVQIPSEINGTMKKKKHI